MAELVEVTTRLTGSCADANICSGAIGLDAIAQPWRQTRGVRSQLDAAGADEARHRQARPLFECG